MCLRSNQRRIAPTICLRAAATLATRRHRRGPASPAGTHAKQYDTYTGLVHMPQRDKEGGGEECGQAYSSTASNPGDTRPE